LPPEQPRSFTITTSSVITAASVRIDAERGRRHEDRRYLNLGPNPNAPPALLSVTLSVSSVPGGTSVPSTVFLNANAPEAGRR